MNSLEFIEKEITNIIEFFELDDVLCLQTNEDYKFCYDRLKTLQQIKTILEAWEEIKKYLILNEGCIYEDSYYEYLTLQNDCIDETESEEQGVSLGIIKKALEVEDE